MAEINPTIRVNRSIFLTLLLGYVNIKNLQEGFAKIPKGKINVPINASANKATHDN